MQQGFLTLRARQGGDEHIARWTGCTTAASNSGRRRAQVRDGEDSAGHLLELHRVGGQEELRTLPAAIGHIIPPISSRIRRSCAPW